MLKYSIPLIAILAASIILITAGPPVVAQTAESTTTITGTIFSDTNGNGVQDAGEPGISGYDMIAIDYATQAVTTATTDDTGMYTFENVAPAPATTLVQAGYFPSGTTVVDPSTSWYRYITPQENSIVTFDVGFYPVPPSELTHLTVTVYDDANRNGTRDAGETGIPHLEMIVYTYTSGGPILTTNTSGIITANPVPADFLVGFYNPMAPPLTLSAPAGYAPTVYNYERSDAATTLGMYNPNDLVADEPAPSSTHTMEIGLVPVNYVQLASTVKIDSADIIDASEPSADTNFGFSVAGIDDIDGDGVADLAVGTPGQIVGETGTGDVFLIFMNSDGSVKNTTEINSQTPNGPTLEAGDRFGASMAGIGDIDGDGVADLAVSTPGHTVGSASTGDVFLIFMNSDGSVKNTTEINSQTPNGPTLEAGDRFGASMAGIGDIDGDGVADLAVGAPGHLVGSASTGDVFLIFMNSDGSVKNTTEINSQTPNGPNLAAGDRFGECMAELGDIDGDGVEDLTVCAPGHISGETGTGGVFLIFMNSDGSVKDTAEINAQTPNGPNLEAGDRFGESIASIGDLDGDGGVEIVAGMPHSSTVYIMFTSSN